MADWLTPQPSNEPVLAYLAQSTETLALRHALSELKNRVTEIPLHIGGEKILGRETTDIVCPHDHKRVLARYRQCTEADIKAAIASACSARQSWNGLPLLERAGVFLKAADLLATKYRARMNAATMLGQSKTVHQAEIDAACELIDFWRFNARFAEKIAHEQPESARGEWNRADFHGLEGFVFALTPFNFTSICVNLATAPALMGCGVVWKPASTAILACHVAMEILEEAGLPPGVINLVTGGHDVIGNAVLNSEHLAGMHFTGSTNTFNYFWKNIGERIDRYRCYPRLVGETGGKDFVLATETANVDQLVTALVRGAFEYQGQKCSAASRAFIHKAIWPAVKEKLCATVNELSVGDPEDFSHFMGAVIDKRAFEKIKGYIEEAKKATGKAEVIAGGQCDNSKGYFIRPTVILAKDPSYRTMVEEIFGPVLTVHVYDDFDTAVRLVDESTPYALTGAIFATDRPTIAYLTQRLAGAAGNFYINDKPTGAVVGRQPFGGSRKSGTNDKAGSVYNLLRWVSHRSIKENFLPITQYRYPHMDSK
jgi:1-pyrroline-5-carboxylate dehydrogenase